MIFSLFMFSVGYYCDTDHRYPEGTDVGDSVISRYVAHKLSLQRNLHSKLSKKDPVPAPAVVSNAADVAAETAVAEPSTSPVCFRSRSFSCSHR